MKSFIENKAAQLSLDEKIGLTLTILLEGSTYLPAIEGYVGEYNCGGIRVVPAQVYKQKMVIDRAKRERGEERLERIYIPRVGALPPKVTLEQYAQTLARYHQLALSRPHGLPLRVVCDQEGGYSRDFTFGGAPIFPKPMGLTASGDPKMAYEAAKATGRVARALGINMIHSPILDVNVEPDNPEIYTRSFSDDPEVVAAFGLEAARGYQESGLIATGKHFPGRGDSTGDAHFEIPVIDIDWDTLWNRDLYPYRVLVENNLLPAIMTAHSVYPAVDPNEIATLSAPMLQGVLRDKMGFTGVITTDAIGMEGVTLKYDVVTACEKALLAGVDMILLRMSTEDPIGPFIPQIIQRIREAVEKGRLSEEELDAKVMRILTSYEQAGLFATGGVAVEPVEEVAQDPHIQAVCRESSRRSICLYRDEDGLLPLPRNQRALVIEQSFPLIYCPNDGDWYPGLFYDSLSAFSNELSLIQTDVKATADEEALVLEHLDRFDLVIMTNWFYRGGLESNNELARKIAAAGKRLVVVGNTPYENQCVPKEARTVLVQFGVTPESIRAAAGIVFGEQAAVGTWPVQYRP